LDERNFSRAVLRRLPAEVAYDAIQQATASNSRVAELLASNDGRAIAIPSAGRRGGNSDQQFILSVFGRSTRENNCDCDRSSEPTLLQTVLLQNDDAMLRMIDVRKGSWLQDVATELGIQKRGRVSAQETRQIASTERQITNFKARLRKLRTTKNTKLIEAAEKRLAALQRQLRKLRPKQPQAEQNKDENDAAGPEKIARLITQAYLRTLGRYPDEREMGRSQQYVHESEDPVDGLRDVLWALLNTKEFIVNH
jgi:hypothetical protein